MGTLYCGTCCKPLSIIEALNVEDSCGVVYVDKPRKVWGCSNMLCGNTASVVDVDERDRRTWWKRIIWK